jgi:hypothetical protein
MNPLRNDTEHASFPLASLRRGAEQATIRNRKAGEQWFRTWS